MNKGATKESGHFARSKSTRDLDKQRHVDKCECVEKDRLGRIRLLSSQRVVL